MSANMHKAWRDKWGFSCQPFFCTVITFAVFNLDLNLTEMKQRTQNCVLNIVIYYTRNLRIKVKLFAQQIVGWQKLWLKVYIYSMHVIIKKVFKFHFTVTLTSGKLSLDGEIFDVICDDKLESSRKEEMSEKCSCRLFIRRRALLEVLNSFC